MWAWQPLAGLVHLNPFGNLENSDSTATRPDPQLVQFCTAPRSTPIEDATHRFKRQKVGYNLISNMAQAMDSKVVSPEKDMI